MVESEYNNMDNLMLAQKIVSRVPSISEANISEPPTPNYKAFLYKFTNLENGKVYLGIHKGSVDDGYYNSSTSDEFKSVYTNSNSSLKYEVLKYGTYDEMKNLEHQILTEADAANSEDYYNKHNGSKARPQQLRMGEALKLYQDIVAGKYDVKDENGEFVKEDKVDIYNLPRIQVRVFRQISALVSEITQRVQDKMGNTDDCEPILIYEQRVDGQDYIGDGNNTIDGVYNAPNAIDVPTRRIPKDVHEKYSDVELRVVSGLLNKKPEVVKEPNTPEDAVKHIVSVYVNTGLPYNAQQNVEWCELMRFTQSQIKKNILPKAKEAIEKLKLELADQVFISYESTSPYHKQLEDTCESLRTSKTHAVSTSSSNIRLDRIQTKFRLSGKSNLVIVVYHPTLSAVDKWKTVKVEHDTEIDYWIRSNNNVGSVKWKVMPYLVENKLVSA